MRSAPGSRCAAIPIARPTASSPATATPDEHGARDDAPDGEDEDRDRRDRDDRDEVDDALDDDRAEGRRAG